MAPTADGTAESFSPGPTTAPGMLDISHMKIAYSICLDPSVPVTQSASGDGNSQPSTSGMPCRPQFTLDLNELRLVVTRYHKYMDWADARIQELEPKPINPEPGQHLLHDEVVTLKRKIEEQDGKIEKQNGMIEELHKGNAAYRHVIDQQATQKSKDIEEKMATLVRREHEFEAKEAKRRQRVAETSAEQDLFDAIEALGLSLKKALREMRTLVAGKVRPQQAFERWESRFCEPTIQLVKLTERVRSTRNANTQREKDLTQRTTEFELKRTELTRATNQLKAEKDLFAKEQNEWRRQLAQNLEGAELKAVKEMWLKIQEETVKPQLLAEATSNSYDAAKRDLLEQSEEQAREAKKTGFMNGRVDGLRQGRAEISKDMNEKVGQARKEGLTKGRERGYAEGLTTGKEQGLFEGRNEAQAKGLAACAGIFFKGVHCGILMPEWEKQDLLKADGKANASHPYWWGRMAAHCIKKHGL
jgi:hypothetical protein